MTEQAPRHGPIPRMTRRATWMPLAGLAVVLIAAIAAVLLSRGVSRANAWVAHSLRAQVTITELGERLTFVESAARGYMLRPDDTLLEDAEDARGGIEGRLKLLRLELADNPEQVARLATIERLIEARLRYLDTRIALYRDAERRGAIVIDGNGLPLAVRIRAELQRMFLAERRLMAQRQLRTQRLTDALSIGLAATVLLVVLIAYATVTDARARYRELRDTHRRARGDMLARVEAETQLAQFHKMESIGQLSGGIAHDFNNMLAVIIGSLDMARRRANQPEKAERHIASAIDGAERAATLVQRLLAFSRRQPLAPAPIDPNAMIAGMTDLLERSLGETVTIAVRLAPGIWPIRADPGQLENALLNLAVNARDAMPGGGTLTLCTANRALAVDELRAHPDVPPGDYAMIAVEDQGEGMSAEVRARAFDPFFTTKGVGKGTGLGLSQVFGFVKQSGGHVTLDAGDDGGTVVRLFLPRTGDAAPAPAPALIASAANAGRGERILVVEDDERVRTFSIEALRELGYAPIAAENGAAALDLLKREREPDLVFTDVVMPGIGGPELARIIRAARPAVRILYTTGYARDQHGMGPIDPGARVLAKPFTVAQLAQRVREALDA